MSGPLPLPLRLFENDNDPEAVKFRNLLTSLINGALDPSAAAHELDEWVVGNANSRLAEVLKRENPHALTDEEEDRGVHRVSFAPNPAGDLSFFIGGVGQAATAFPPDHPAQNRLLEMFKVLKGMPPKKVPQSTPDDLSGQLHAQLLYRDFSDCIDVEQWLKEYAERELSYEWSGIEKPGTEEQQRWCNFQAFIARLTQIEFCDLSRLSALAYILPEKHPKEGSLGSLGRLSGQAVAAAQWILRDDVGKFVYASCVKESTDSAQTAFWNMDRWKVWKEQFKRIAEDTRYDQNGRQVAKLAVAKMDELEA